MTEPGPAEKGAFRQLLGAGNFKLTIFYAVVEESEASPNHAAPGHREGFTDQATLSASWLADREASSRPTLRHGRTLYWGGLKWTVLHSCSIKVTVGRIERECRQRHDFLSEASRG